MTVKEILSNISDEESRIGFQDKEDKLTSFWLSDWREGYHNDLNDIVITIVFDKPYDILLIEE